MRGTIGIILITSALLLQACGKSVQPATNSAGTGTGTGATQHLYEAGCDLLAGPFGAGDGSVANPYLICSATQLANVADPRYASGHFSVVKNLDLTGAPMMGISDFSGVFDGNSHTLSNLSPAMLFANSSGTIRNVKLSNANVVGSYQSGLFVGWNQAGGSISNCHAQGKLNASYGIGGFVGRNDGTITGSSADVALQGVDSLGGFAGVNKGTIGNSFSLGSVVGSNPTRGIVGGFVGDNYSGTISDSYSRSSAAGVSFNVGGFFGQNEATLVNCYSTGAVAGSAANVGGFGGLNTGTVTSSYWDTQTSGLGASSGGTAKTTLEMQTQGTFVGWTFGTVWVLSAGYPSLL